LNVYHEARSETVLGQKAVAWVTLNRTANSQYPNDICSVVKQPYQFSWYKGKMHLPLKDLSTYNQIKTLAEQTIKDFKSKMKDPTNGALFYHTTEVNPLWADPQYITTQIGNHIFYKKAAVIVASK